MSSTETTTSRPVTGRFAAIVENLDRVPVWLRAVPALAAMGTLWWSSSQQAGDLPPGLGYSFLWNSAHFAAFGVLALLMFLGLPLPVSDRRLWLAGLGAAGYGVIDEVHQGFGGMGRVMDGFDVASDAMGALCAVGVLGWGLGRPRPWCALALCSTLLGIGSVLGASLG